MEPRISATKSKSNKLLLTANASVRTKKLNVDFRMEGARNRPELIRCKEMAVSASRGVARKRAAPSFSLKIGGLEASQRSRGVQALFSRRSNVR